MNDITALVLDRVRVLAPVLDEAMSVAILQAETRAQGFDHARFPHSRPLTIRQDVRLALEAVELPGGWQVAGDPRLMGQLILRDDQTGMRLHFLKAPYSQPDRIPHAGRSTARRSEWSKPLPGMGGDGWLADSDGLLGAGFLLIWAYRDASIRTNGYDLRIVHPLVPGRFGAATLCDLDLTIPRGGILGEENLRFVGPEDDEDLFSFGLSADPEATGTE